MTPGEAPAAVPYFDALRDQLVHAAGRRGSGRGARRPVRLLVAAAAVILVAGTGALLGVAPDPASADVEVRRAGDRVELRLVGRHVEPEDIEQAARQAGIRVSVSRYPVGPSLVDRFVAVETDRPLPPSFVRLDETTGKFSGFFLSASWPGTLRLGLGQPARGDEPYAKTSDAFARGEPLACLDIRGRPAVNAAAAVSQLGGLRVRWEIEAAEGWRPTTPRRSPAATVVRAEATSRSDVVVFLAEGGAPPARTATGCKPRPGGR